MCAQGSDFQDLDCAVFGARDMEMMSTPEDVDTIVDKSSFLFCTSSAKGQRFLCEPGDQRPQLLHWHGADFAASAWSSCSHQQRCK